MNENGRMYGYEIAQSIKENSEGKILVKEGSLYPALHKLEADGYLWVEEEFIGKRVRRYYHLTEGGISQTHQAIKELHHFITTISKMVEPKTPILS